jgi:ABC-type branched-subunit amino acid transport system substrate-binding protein
MQRRDFLKRLGAGVLLAGAGGLMAACAAPTGPGAGSSAPAAGTAAGAVKVGILTDLTGVTAAAGKSLLNNAQLAKEQIEAGGKLKFDLVVEDMASDPKTSVEKATKLVQSDKVAAVIGVISSAAREAVRPVICDRGKLPFIYTTGYEGGDCNANLWCVGMVPPQQVNPYVDWLLANQGKKFYFFGADYVWPRSMFEQTRALVEKGGGTVLGEDYAPMPASDFTTLVTHLNAAQPDVLISAFPTPAWTNAVQQISDAGLRKNLHIGTYFMSDWFAESIPAGIRDGISTLGNYFYDVSGGANETYLSKYHAKFGGTEPTDGLGVGAYWAMHMYADAVAAAGSTAADKIRPALTASKFAAGPTGPVTFNPDHHLTTNTYLAVTKNGAFKVQKTYDNVVPKQACTFA